MSHTPGPWRASVVGLAFDITAEEGAVVIAQRGPWRSRPDEVAANARLIAAAPDLYDALLSLRAASNPAARRLARRWADEAIAKATGEVPA